MRQLLPALFTVMLVAGSSLPGGCCPKRGYESSVSGQGSYFLPPDGESMVDYITRENPYTHWDLWPGKGRMHEGRRPHGAFLTTYLSPLAYGAVTGQAGEMPDSSFIVKENCTPEKELTAITVMYKREGYNPGGGDWFWLKLAPDGTIRQEGKVASCIDCHKSARDNDWLFTGPIK